MKRLSISYSQYSGAYHPTGNNPNLERLPRMEPSVLRLGPLQDGNRRIGILPEPEEVFVICLFHSVDSPRGRKRELIVNVPLHRGVVVRHGDNSARLRSRRFPPGELEALLNLSAPDVRSNPAQLHWCRAKDGSPMICLNSLPSQLQSITRGFPRLRILRKEEK